MTSDDGCVTIGASAMLALKILCCRPAALVSSNGSLTGHAIDVPMTYVSPDGVAELNSVLDDPQDPPCEGLYRLQSLSDLQSLLASRAR